jgi:hypothetical protein
MINKMQQRDIMLIILSKSMRNKERIYCISQEEHIVPLKSLLKLCEEF